VEGHAAEPAANKDPASLQGLTLQYEIQYRTNTAAFCSNPRQKTLARGLASDEAVNLRQKSLVVLTRSSGRQIQQLSRHE
jgi:hypothetical protein